MKNNSRKLTFALVICFLLEVILPLYAFALPDAAEGMTVQVDIEDVDIAGGQFTVRAEGITQDARMICTEVWNAVAGKEEARRYAHLYHKSDSVWSAVVPLADFDYAEGEYLVQVYALDSAGVRTDLGTASVSVAFSAGQMTCIPDPRDTAFEVSITDVVVPRDLLVWFVVRSESGGGNDQLVYPALRNADSCHCNIQIPYHRQAGCYQVAAFYGSSIENGHILGKTTFEVQGLSESGIAITDIDRQRGTFRVSAHVSAPSGIDSVRVAVWCREDQSDIRWYDAAGEDGVYNAAVDIASHGCHFGIYKAHAYAVLGNGIEILIGGTEADIQPLNYLTVTEQGGGSYRITVLGPSTDDSHMQLATWSLDKGQDDLVWYQGSSQDDGTVQALVSAKRHRSSGPFMTHLYVAGQLAGAIQYDVAPLKVAASDVPLTASEASNQRVSWYFARNKNRQPPQGAWSQDTLSKYDAYYLGDTSRKIIYLTFDCGYDNGNTAKILDVLKANQVPAAFFVTKGFLAQAPALARRMAAEGHVVGNHTVNHPDMTKISEKQFVSELETCAQKYREVTGRDMDPFFRPPEGVFNRQSLQRAQALGYSSIFWSLAYKDWDVNAQPSIRQAYDHLMTYTHNGCIPLLHGISSANAGALDSVIKALKAEGYEFGSLYDLP